MRNIYTSKNTPVKTWLLPGRKRIVFILFIALLLFSFIAWVVFIAGGSTMDERVFEALTPQRTGTLTQIMRLITFLGNTAFLIIANILLIVIFCRQKNYWFAITVAVVALSNVIVMSALKRLFQRQRPADPLIQGITNFSFPSGHAFMSVAFYGLLIWFTAITITDKYLQKVIIIFLLLLILLIGFSRIYLRVHYTTDILAGFTLGFTWLIISLMTMNEIQSRKMKRL
ncbi:MAG: phosphatase PAP2 family protein [Bacteroidota bacterium]|nr:phosphatase PAP2 family protein [Chitinophagaceae bacterium]MDZ4807200.1 phosphatase PAP2 family protein [Bacteroidota bacterium]